jgi:hypothetical protein
MYKTIKTLNEYDSDKYYYIIYITLILSTYILFLGLFYLHWSINNIIYIILMISVLMSFVVIILFFLSAELCKVDSALTNNGIKYLILSLLGIVWILAFFDDVSNYSLRTTVKLVIELFLMAIIYYLIKKYDHPYIKIFADITTGIIFYHEAMRFYYSTR